jgi:hypothetical protein
LLAINVNPGYATPVAPFDGGPEVITKGGGLLPPPPQLAVSRTASIKTIVRIERKRAITPPRIATLRSAADTASAPCRVYVGGMRGL